MLKAKFQKHNLQFKFEAGTSRGVLKQRETWFISLWNDFNPGCVGVGECAPLKGLSVDDRPDFEDFLGRFCASIAELDFPIPGIDQFPSIQFGFDTALKDLHFGGKKQIYNNDFYYNRTSIPINGLIWMGTEKFMYQQIEEKLELGFNCLKLKIGALDFELEKSIVSSLRKQFSDNDISIRLDANGALGTNQALEKLNQLADLQIHSIEQPIRQGQIEEMARLCELSPIPIALDEELIGVKNKQKLLDDIKPPFIILKPTLLGGFLETDGWIECATKRGIGWWITSALESNVGLNAICQYTQEKIKDHLPLIPQGLGTGGLFTNNISSPLFLNRGEIRYNQSLVWDDLPK